MNGSIKLLTVTWSGDKTHFALLRASLQKSALSHLRHDVVVQDEDISLFSEYQQQPLVLLSTRDVLPIEVESRRQRARKQQAFWGRHGAKLGGSMARRWGWPRWVRYTGWHTQQLSKLAQVAASEEDTVVVVDSDVIVTRHATVSDFLASGKFVCFEAEQDVSRVRGKTANWHATAHRLFGQPMPSSGRLDCYFDTPFVLHAPTVRAMMAWLEQRYQKPWWQVLIGLPPRRWSEFGCYKRFIRACVAPELVQWRSTDFIGYLFDASDPTRLIEEFDALVDGKGCHYVTIHSQSSGRGLWGPDAYAEQIRARLAVASMD